MSISRLGNTTIERFAKSGCDRSCLHNEVPNTPQPTIAILSEEDDVELIGEEFDNGDEEKALTTILLLDNSIDIDRRNRG